MNFHQNFLKNAGMNKKARLRKEAYKLLQEVKNKVLKINTKK